MLETSVFLVMGVTGEYEAVREWVVAAYADESMANAHARAENGRHAALSQRFKWRDGCDYTGTKYSVITVPMLSAVPHEDNK